MRRIISKILLMAGLTAALSSCNGIMGGLYDEPQNEETPTYGFLKKATAHTLDVYMLMPLNMTGGCISTFIRAK